MNIPKLKFPKFEDIMPFVFFGGFFLLIGFSFKGCNADRWEDFYVPKTEIVGVYMHKVGTYSVAIQEDYQIRIAVMPRLPNGNYRSMTPVIIADVPADQPMWYMCEGRKNEGFFAGTQGKPPTVEGGCEIHIRSIDNVVGGPWSNGKFGSGHVNRVDQ